MRESNFSDLKNKTTIMDKTVLQSFESKHLANGMTEIIDKSDLKNQSLLNNVVGKLEAEKLAMEKELLYPMHDRAWKQHNTTLQECIEGINLIRSLGKASNSYSREISEKAILASKNGTLARCFTRCFTEAKPNGLEQIAIDYNPPLNSLEQIAVDYTPDTVSLVEAFYRNEVSQQEMNEIRKRHNIKEESDKVDLMKTGSALELVEHSSKLPIIKDIIDKINFEPLKDVINEYEGEHSTALKDHLANIIHYQDYKDLAVVSFSKVQKLIFEELYNEPSLDNLRKEFITMMMKSKSLNS